MSQHRGRTSPPRSSRSTGVFLGSSPSDAGVAEWRGVSRHPQLELRHTVEDRMMVATSVSYLPLRAFFHRNRDTMVCFSEVIREITTSGHATQDRILVITDKHLYVSAMPSLVVFAGAATGGCFALRDFVKMSIVNGTQHALFQFIGATIAMRFTSAKDASRCGTVVFSVTGVPVDSVAPQDLGTLHNRRVIGAPNSLAHAISLAATNTTLDGAADNESSAAAPSTTTGTSKQQLARERAIPQGATTSVDNMLRFILEEADGNMYESLYPEVAIQATPNMAETSTQSVPLTRDVGTSPFKKKDMLHRTRPLTPKREFGVKSDHHSPMRRTLTFGPESGGERFGELEDTDDESSSMASEFDPGSMWRSLNRTAAGPATGDSAAGASKLRDVNSGTTSSVSNSSRPGSTLDFDTWLGGLLVQYKPALAELGLDSISKLTKLEPDQLEEAMNEAGILQMGHRALLSTKLAVTRNSKSRSNRASPERGGAWAE